VDDRLKADEALRRIRAGEALLFLGDYHNARQLLSAIARRLGGRRSSGDGKAHTPTELWRLERARRATEHALLSRLLVPLDDRYRVALRRGPDALDACEPVWGPPQARSRSRRSGSFWG
jgi:hypothetical protein